MTDAPFIAEIYRPHVETGWASFEQVAPSANDIAERIASAGETYPWLIAEAGEPLAYAYASQHRSRAAYQNSVDTTIYCTPNAQGRGVGRRLYQALLDTLTWQNFIMAFAGIALPNPASIALHQAVGFSLVGTYPNVGFKAGAWRDTQWWSRPLAEPHTPPKSILPVSESFNDLFR